MKRKRKNDDDVRADIRDIRNDAATAQERPPPQSARKELRLTPALAAMIDRAAEAAGLTASDWIRARLALAVAETDGQTLTRWPAPGRRGAGAPGRRKEPRQ